MASATIAAYSSICACLNSWVEAVAFSLHIAPTLRKNGEGLAIPLAFRPNSDQFGQGPEVQPISSDTLSILQAHAVFILTILAPVGPGVGQQQNAENQSASVWCTW